MQPSPLHRYRIVHLTLNLPAPLAISRLAQAGMQVTKIEPPTGDPLEGYYPDWYRSIHQGQTILRLDLKSPEPRARLDELLGEAHLFVTSLRPSALRGLGLDENSLKAKFPALQIVRLGGYPAPDEDSPSHDLTCQAHAGLLTPPALPRALISDYAASERLFSMCLLALLESGSKKGASRVVTLSEMAEEFAQPLRVGMTSEKGPLGGSLPHYAIYPAKEGWVAVAALEPHFLKRLLTLLGLQKPERDAFTRVFQTKTASEWERLGKDSDIPLASVT